jgi:hypothetical protein
MTGTPVARWTAGAARAIENWPSTSVLTSRSPAAAAAIKRS